MVWLGLGKKSTWLVLGKKFTGLGLDKYVMYIK